MAINKFLKQSASKILTFHEEIVTQTERLEKIFCAWTPLPLTSSLQVTLSLSYG